jgi:hypothetical protein
VSLQAVDGSNEHPGRRAAQHLVDVDADHVDTGERSNVVVSHSGEMSSIVEGMVTVVEPWPMHLGCELDHRCGGPVSTLVEEPAAARFVVSCGHPRRNSPCQANHRMSEIAISRRPDLRVA